MVKSSVFLAVFLWVLAAPGYAQNWATTCIDTVVTAVTEVTPGGIACFNFETEGLSDSAAISVRAASALFCLNPADDSDGADTAQVEIRRCSGGSNITATDNNCPQITDAPLDGTPGADGTQKTCRRVKRGVYYIEVTTAGNADENPYVSVEAEE